MAGDAEKMIGIGIVWGVTNSLMRRGAQIWDQNLMSSPPNRHRGLLGKFIKWVDLILIWQYSIPFLVNLSASACFFYILGDSPLSIAVPVTNATTFAATAVSAMVLGEEMRIGYALFGTCNRPRRICVPTYAFRVWYIFSLYAALGLGLGRLLFCSLILLYKSYRTRMRALSYQLDNIQPSTWELQMPTAVASFQLFQSLQQMAD